MRGEGGGVRPVCEFQSVSKSQISLEEGFAAAPHDGGLALGGMRRLCIAGKGGKEHSRKGKEKFPKPYVV